MTARISPSVSSPLNVFRVCVACGKIGNSSVLVTHTGNKGYAPWPFFLKEVL